MVLNEHSDVMSRRYVELGFWLPVIALWVALAVIAMGRVL